MDLRLNRTKPGLLTPPQLCEDLNAMDDDICEDGTAVDHPIIDRLKAMESRFSKPQSDDYEFKDYEFKQDSGIESLSITSLRSSDSLYSSCDINKRTSQLSTTVTTGDLRNVINSEAAEIIFSRFGALRVSEKDPIQTRIAEKSPIQTVLASSSTHLPSIDDGFCSRSESFPETHDSRISDQQDTEQQTHIDRLHEELIQIFTQDQDGDTHLHLATIQMVPHVAISMIDKAPGYEFLSLPNNLHQTPLHLAVITNQPSVVRRLMVGGACITAKDRGGNTPLHIACQEGYLECIKCLTTPLMMRETEINLYDELPIQRIPQNLNDTNYEGQTFVHIAVESYLTNSVKWTSMYAVVEHLLIIGANINAQDVKSGRTVLHYAADRNCIPLIEMFLLHRTINVNAKTYSGKTAAHFSHARGFDGITRMLLATGAEPIDLNLGESDSADDSSSDEEMGDDSMYDDICIAGEPLVHR